MKLVLLFFCGILIFIIVTFILIIFSNIKLNVEKCYISNVESKRRKSKLEKEVLIYLEFYLLGIIKIFKIRVTKALLERLKIKNDIESIENDAKAIKESDIKGIVKMLKLKTEKIELYLDFGTESLMLTVYLTAIISALVGIICANIKPKKVKFKIMPLYNIGNSIKFSLNCIINAKVVHIIYVIYILLRKRRSKNERTSNRRSYGYSYE